MKLKPEKREIDLYVSNKKLTKKEHKEFSDFIKAYKEKQKLTKDKRKKTA